MNYDKCLKEVLHEIMLKTFIEWQRTRSKKLIEKLNWYGKFLNMKFKE